MVFSLVAPAFPAGTGVENTAVRFPGIGPGARLAAVSAVHSGSLKELARGGDESPVIPRAPPSVSYDGGDGEVSVLLDDAVFSYSIAGAIPLEEYVH